MNCKMFDINQILTRLFGMSFYFQRINVKFLYETWFNLFQLILYYYYRFAVNVRKLLFVQLFFSPNNK